MSLCPSSAIYIVTSDTAPHFFLFFFRKLRGSQQYCVRSILLVLMFVTCMNIIHKLYRRNVGLWPNSQGRHKNEHPTVSRFVSSSQQCVFLYHLTIHTDFSNLSFVNETIKERFCKILVKYHNFWLYFHSYSRIFLDAGVTYRSWKCLWINLSRYNARITISRIAKLCGQSCCSWEQ